MGDAVTLRTHLRNKSVGGGKNGKEKGDEYNLGEMAFEIYIPNIHLNTA